MSVWLGLAALLAFAVYWELVWAEGAHLGPRVVVWLYDVVAHRYDAIKKFDFDTETTGLGQPLVDALRTIPAPLVLDVAAGTGRVVRAVCAQSAFTGTVINVDLSTRMMVHGQSACAQWRERIQWACSPADALPFADHTFDAVTCLEALEFMPNPRAALAECVRVLKPGGVLVVTNRIGWERWLVVGKTFTRAGFLRLLTTLPLTQVRVVPWLVDYDLMWARKVSFP